MGQYNQPLIESLEIPKNSQTGSATHAANEPLMANTIKMAIMAQLFLIPHLTFSRSSIFRSCFKHQP